MQFAVTGNNPSLFNERLRILKDVLLHPIHYYNLYSNNEIVCEGSFDKMEVFVNTKDY